MRKTATKNKASTQMNIFNSKKQKTAQINQRKTNQCGCVRTIQNAKSKQARPVVAKDEKCPKSENRNFKK